jgi:uncharacterized integral membrane protein (TIGR00697 family)
MVFFLWLGTRLPAAPFWEDEAAWDSILGLVPRITAASWIAFLVSENLDAWVFDVFRRIPKGRHLWMRNVFSSISALTVDTFLLCTLIGG